MSNTIYNNNNSLQEALRLLRDKAIPSGPDTSDATASAEAILDGEIAYNAEGRVVGTMPNNGAINVSIDGIDTKSVTIAEGYTSGGTISLDDTIDTEVGEQADLIAQLRDEVNNLPEAEDVVDVGTKILNGTLEEYTNNNVSAIRPQMFISFNDLTAVTFKACKTVGVSAFQSCTKLTAVNIPACNTINPYAFSSCTSLVDVNAPLCTSIGNYAFYSCSKLNTTNFLPSCSYIGTGAFYYASLPGNINLPYCSSLNNVTFAHCKGMNRIDLPICTYVGGSAFSACGATEIVLGSQLASDAVYTPKIEGYYAFYQARYLSSLKLCYNCVATLTTATATFADTAITNSSYYGTYGSIYVPASLVEAYKTATNWATYASKITAIPEDSEGGE